MGAEAVISKINHQFNGHGGAELQNRCCDHISDRTAQYDINIVWIHVWGPKKSERETAWNGRETGVNAYSRAWTPIQGRERLYIKNPTFLKDTIYMI